MAIARALTAALLVLLGAGATAQEPDKGKTVYVTHCQSCHGADASGGQGPPLVPFDVDLAEFTTLVRQGVGLMPPFPRSKIEDEQIAELHTYLSSLNKSSLRRTADERVVAGTLPQGHESAAFFVSPRTHR